MESGVDVLYRAGLRDENLATTAQWLGRSLVSALMLELHSSMTGDAKWIETPQADDGFHRKRERLENIRLHIDAQDKEEIFRFHIERTIDSIDCLIQQK